MNSGTFNNFCKIIYDYAGISLHEGKKALVTARINKRIRALGLGDYEAYLDYVKTNRRGDEIINLIDVISTNVTHFYREPDHFEFLKDIFIKWQDQGQERFRFWCAAASTGQEPYTLAITLLENELSAGLDWKLLATDISTKVLNQCHEGRYTQDHLKTVPKSMVMKYFDREKDEFGEPVYKVKGVLKQKIKFARLNLSKQPFPMKGPLDIVFCRNVMIYFDMPTKNRLVNEIYRLIRPGGYLIVGHAESLTGMETGFRMVRPSVYHRPVN